MSKDLWISRSGSAKRDDDLGLLPSFQDSSRWFLEVLRGVSFYRVHPFQRQSPNYVEIWREGQTRLLSHKDFDVDNQDIAIIVPSFINDYYIGDLTPQSSLLVRLEQLGINVAIIDWGDSLDEEGDIGMGDYCRRLVSMSHEIASNYKGKPILIGHCLGGLISLSAGLKDCQDIRGVVLVSSPWDFSDIRGHMLMPTLEKLYHDTIRDGFLWQNAVYSLDRFRRFGSNFEQEDTDNNIFVAVEDWLLSGFDMSLNLSRDLKMLSGRVLRLEDLWWLDRRGSCRRLEVPCSMIVPLKDRVVPPRSSLGVIECLSDVRVFPFNTGHLGAVAGGHIDKTLEVVVDNMKRSSRAKIEDRAKIYKMGCRPVVS